MTLKNSEGNIILTIWMGAATEEGWIPCSLELVTPTKTYSSCAHDLYMSCMEQSDFIHGWRKIADNLEKGEGRTYHYCNSEGYFEVILESLPMDEVVEVWVNMGNHSGGTLYGYDEGIRFVVSQESISKFVNGISTYLLT